MILWLQLDRFRMAEFPRVFPNIGTFMSETPMSKAATE